MEDIKEVARLILLQVDHNKECGKDDKFTIDVALIRMFKSRYKAQCAISFIRCYVLGGLSAHVMGSCFYSLSF